MAIKTRDFDVAPEKRELSHVMVKGVCVQSDNIRISTFVFGMATLAVDSRDVGISAVEASLSGDILIDVLMAKKAQFVLLALSKTAMTLVTVTFELGVALYDGPRHHQRLQYSRSRCGHLTHQANSYAKCNPNSHGSRLCMAEPFPGNPRVLYQYMWTATTCAIPVIINITKRGI